MGKIKGRLQRRRARNGEWAKLTRIYFVRRWGCAQAGQGRRKLVQKTGRGVTGEVNSIKSWKVNGIFERVRSTTKSTKLEWPHQHSRRPGRLCREGVMKKKQKKKGASSQRV